MAVGYLTPEGLQCLLDELTAGQDVLFGDAERGGQPNDVPVGGLRQKSPLLEGKAHIPRVQIWKKYSFLYSHKNYKALSKFGCHLSKLICQRTFKIDIKCLITLANGNTDFRTKTYYFQM